MTEISVSWKMAELAFRASEYEVSINYLKEYIEKDNHKLDRKEMDFFGACYKKLISLYRDPLQHIMSNMSKCSEVVKSTLQDHKANLNQRVVSVCNDALNVIDSILLPSSDTSIQTLYYNKLKGDYHRYLAEIAPRPDIREDYVNKAKTCYESAFIAHDESISPSEPLYMCFILNYSVFLAEMLGLKRDAIERLESVFDDAFKSMDNLQPEDYKESAMLLQVFKDNINMWKNDRLRETEKVRSQNS